MLSQLRGISELADVRHVAIALLLYAIGTVAGVITWALGFVSTRHVDRTLRGQNQNYRLADKFMFGASICFCVSIAVFFLGALVLVAALQ